MTYYVIRLPMFQEDEGRTYTVGAFATRKEAEGVILTQCRGGYLQRHNFKIMKGSRS